MKILLQSETGVDLREIEVPRMTPWPEVVTLSPGTFRYHEALATKIIYRQCFAVDLNGFLPAGGLRDARIERA